MPWIKAYILCLFLFTSSYSVTTKAAVASFAQCQSLFDSDISNDSPSGLRYLWNQLGKASLSFETYAQQRYGKYGKTALHQLRQLQLEELITDLGTVLRIDAFVDFYHANSSTLKNLSPWKIREKFAKSLGTVTRYRGMALSPSEATKILRSGINHSELYALIANKSPTKMQFDIENAGVYFNKERTEDSMFRTYSEIAIADLVQNHVQANPASSIISVSQRKDVAQALAHEANQTTQQGPQTLYLFKLKLPRIDVFSIQDILKFYSKREYENLRSKDNRFVLYGPSLKKEASFNFNDPIVEEFVLYRIGASEIVSVERIQNPSIFFMPLPLPRGAQ